MNNKYESESSRCLRRIGYALLGFALIALIAMLIATSQGIQP